MSGVRVRRTRKGAFILTSTGKRQKWDVSGPISPAGNLSFEGSPVYPNRLYASQSSGWFGQLIQRSATAARPGNPVGNKLCLRGRSPAPTVVWDGHASPLGVQARLDLEPSLTDPDTVLAGVKMPPCSKPPTAVKVGTNLAGLRRHGTGSHWTPARRHVLAHDPGRSSNARPDLHAISSAGAFQPMTANTWKAINLGCDRKHIPDPTAEVDTSSIASPSIPPVPRLYSCRTTGT